MPNRNQEALNLSELVTTGLLYAVKVVSDGAFYRWLHASYMDMFPHLPERTRLFRHIRTHRDWTDRLLASLHCWALRMHTELN